MPTRHTGTGLTGAALQALEGLDLGSNKGIRDAGVDALSAACARGALPALKKIAVGTKRFRQLVAACEPRGIAIS